MTSMCLDHPSVGKVNWENNNLTVVRRDIVKRQKRPHVQETDGHLTHSVLFCLIMSCTEITCELKSITPEVKNFKPQKKNFKAGESVEIICSEKAWVFTKETSKTFMCQDNGGRLHVNIHMTSMCLDHPSVGKVNWEKNNLTVVRRDIVKRLKVPHVQETDGHLTHSVLVCSAVKY
ncbi:Nuclear egress protein 2 [Labeo rohita]|uniref:Nuclear egress protein 2 n=1 Tax=Labeo rohita TaxID=84645 RepID=A0ABQ8L3A7_LABRO|nr:Nuclear egress protein 2 [Labeo rohita]